MTEFVTYHEQFAAAKQELTTIVNSTNTALHTYSIGEKTREEAIALAKIVEANDTLLQNVFARNSKFLSEADLLVYKNQFENGHQQYLPIRNEFKIQPEDLGGEVSIVVLNPNEPEDPVIEGMITIDEPEPEPETEAEKILKEIELFSQKLSQLLISISTIEEIIETEDLDTLEPQVESLTYDNKEVNGLFDKIQAAVLLDLMLTQQLQGTLFSQGQIKEGLNKRVKKIEKKYKKRLNRERSRTLDEPSEPESDSELVEDEVDKSKEQKNRRLALLNGVMSEMRSSGAYQVTADSNALETIVERMQNHFDDLVVLGISDTEKKELRLKMYEAEFAVTKASIIFSFEKLEFNDDGSGDVDTFNNMVMNPLIDKLKAILKMIPEEEKGRFKYEFMRFEKYYDDISTMYFSLRDIKQAALGIVGGATDVEGSIMDVPSSTPVYLNNLNNACFRRIFNNDYPQVKYPELNTNFEFTLSKEIGSRTTQVFDTKNPNREKALDYTQKEVTIRAIPEAMRIFDMFFSGLTPAGMGPSLAKEYQKKRRTLYNMSGGEIHQLVIDYRKEMVRSQYQKDTRKAHLEGRPIPDINDPIYRLEDENGDPLISRKESHRAWNMSIMLMRHFTLAPSSFDKGAPGYYMFQPDYASGEAEGSGKFAPLVYFWFFAYQNPKFAALNSSSVSGFTLDLWESGLKVEDHAGQMNIVEKMVLALANKNQPKDLRVRIERALISNGFDPNKYRMLLDAPICPLAPRGMRVEVDEDGTVLLDENGNPKQRFHYSAFIAPLTNMYLKDISGSAIKNEKGGYMTFADFTDKSTRSSFNPNGSVMYELLDFDACGVEEQMKWWTNQVKNAKNFFSSALFASSEDFVSKSTANNLNELSKLAKYVANLAMPWAHLIRNGEAKADNVIRGYVMSLAKLKSMQSVTSGNDIHHIKHAMSMYTLYKCSPSDLEALIIDLQSGFDSYAGMTKFVDNYVDQIAKALYFPSNN